MNYFKNGTYHDILELNWIQMDVDGDGNLELVLDGNNAGLESPTHTYGLFMDLSYNEKPEEPKRYFIDGKMYEDWENVPKSYKMVLPPDPIASIWGIFSVLAYLIVLVFLICVVWWSLHEMPIQWACIAPVVKIKINKKNPIKIQHLYTWVTMSWQVKRPQNANDK